MPSSTSGRWCAQGGEPNYFLRDLQKDKLKALTTFPHPTPALMDVYKEMLRYERADGVKLTATLYLPPGKTPNDGPFPMLMMAYPREFKSADAAGQVNDALVIRRLRAPQPLGLLARQREPIEKRPISFRRRALARKEQGPASVRGEQDRGAGLRSAEQRSARIAVAIFKGAIEEQGRFRARCGWVDDPGPRAAVLPPPLIGQGEPAIAPGHAAVTHAQRQQFDRLAREGCGEDIDAVANLDILLGVAAVLGLRPVQRGGFVSPPAERARTRPHRAEASRRRAGSC